MWQISNYVFDSADAFLYENKMVEFDLELA